jgi:hypothetical protein
MELRGDSSGAPTRSQLDNGVPDQRRQRHHQKADAQFHANILAEVCCGEVITKVTFPWSRTKVANTALFRSSLAITR